MSKPANSVHDQVVKVTRVYLGPAAERFIDRQVENHIHKSPDDLSAADLSSLIDWIGAVVSLITEDRQLVEKYLAELTKLTDQQSSKK